MRLEGRLKGGFFPAPPGAVSFASSYLTRPPDDQYAILDPCAGQGDAIKQLATRLELPHSRVWCIEIEKRRAAMCAESMPDAKVINASALSASVRHESFSFVWCNPPFDNELGGGYRTELRFLSQAYWWLKPGGIVAFVAPEGVINNHETGRSFLTMFHNPGRVAFPPNVRQYNESICFGVRRDRMASFDKMDWKERVWPPKLPTQGEYVLPRADGPGSMFSPTEPTPQEMMELLGTSPLRAMLRPPPQPELPSPPLSLGTGHVALLLAAGHLNGIVRPEGEPPHVVRGTAKKLESSETTEQQESPHERQLTTVIKERISLVVKAAWQDGTIKAFGEKVDA